MSKNNSISEKVQSLFRDMVGDAASRLDGSHFPVEIRDRIANVLSKDFSEEISNDIAFHLVDWNGDAAFLVALHLWPEQFTDEEISKGLYQLFPHAPDHLAAAAKLFGQPVTNVFEVGAIDGEENEGNEEDTKDETQH
jgi:hypothetical protein